MYGGHYTSRGIRDNKVYNFDDSTVTQSSMEESSNTYMLFYELEKK
jgi:ubiquitin C-terminal hydrolase